MRAMSVRENTKSDCHRKTHGVRAMDIPKASGGTRTLGIPNVQDRVIQDEVNHDILMHRAGQKVRDKRLLRLIGDYLRAPMQAADGRKTLRTKGTPQGGPLSPLLANIYLDPLDSDSVGRPSKPDELGTARPMASVTPAWGLGRSPALGPCIRP